MIGVERPSRSKPAHLDTVHVGQAQIQDHQIRIETFHALQQALPDIAVETS